MKLSIVIPVYNEKDTLSELINRIRQVQLPLEKELIVVDDGSVDGTKAVVESLENVIKVFLPVNRGKGAALREGFKRVSGDIVLIQDADLEYSPQDYENLLKPLLDNTADVVYGTRFLGGGAHRVQYFWHALGNKFLTLLSNMLTNLTLTDMEVGFKLFRTEIIRKIHLEQDRFGFEPEITAKIAKSNYRVYEVPISYYGRTYLEGKKIGWKDGVAALWCIFKYRFFG